MPAHGHEGTCTTSDGAAIAFTRRAAPSAGAPRIVLIHSLALDRSIWDAVACAMQNHAEILTYDCRGHGRSERRAGQFTAELFARDLSELLDHVGWQEATVAGCSMGGCVALASRGHDGDWFGVPGLCGRRRDWRARGDAHVEHRQPPSRGARIMNRSTMSQVHTNQLT
jgi:pimeloyl-ACP methyl ester carboxylesterase